MKKGAIPVPYIIALILGILVVGILGYGFFVLGWKVPGATQESQCNIKRTSFCNEWSRNNYGIEPAGGNWNNYAAGCFDIGVQKPSKYDCKLMFGLKPPGTACTNSTECASGSCTSNTCAAP